MTLLKQIELTTQLQAMSSMRGGGPINNVDEPGSQAEPDVPDDWAEPLADDPTFELF